MDRLEDAAVTLEKAVVDLIGFETLALSATAKFVGDRMSHRLIEAKDDDFRLLVRSEDSDGVGPAGRVPLSRDVCYLMAVPMHELQEPTVCVV